MKEGGREEERWEGGKREVGRERGGEGRGREAERGGREEGGRQRERERGGREEGGRQRERERATESESEREGERKKQKEREKEREGKRERERERERERDLKNTHRPKHHTKEQPGRYYLQQRYLQILCHHKVKAHHLIQVLPETSNGSNVLRINVQWNLGIRDTQGTVKNCPESRGGLISQVHFYVINRTREWGGCP